MMPAFSIAMHTIIVSAATANPGVASSRSAAVALGLTPEVVLAQGVSSAEYASVLSRIDGAEELRAALDQSKQQVVRLLREIAELEHQLATETVEPAVETALSDAMLELRAARIQLSEIKSALLAVAVEGTQCQSGVDAPRIASGRCPPELSIASAPADSLEDAVAAERRAHRRGEELAQEQSTLLVQARAEPAVVAAKVLLEGQLAGAYSALNSLDD